MATLLKTLTPESVGTVGAFPFQWRCLAPGCYLTTPIGCEYQETAESVGGLHVAVTGHSVVIEALDEGTR